MGRRGNAPTRSEVTDAVDKHKSDMSEKVEVLDTVATDAESNANPATGSGVGADGAIVATPGPEAQRPAVDDILADLDRHG